MNLVGGNMRYIIGDVHGCYNTLLALIAKLPKDARITFVGDIIDRGKNSCDVIELIKNNNYDCVLGNHEFFMIEALESFFSQEISFEHDIWYTHNGGKATIDSYHNKEHLIKEHLDWLKNLPLYIQYDDIKVQDRILVVTHSSIGNNWSERTNTLLDSSKKYFIRSVLQKSELLERRCRKHLNTNAGFI